jgi:hypothetical protein
MKLTPFLKVDFYLAEFYLHPTESKSVFPGAADALMFVNNRQHIARTNCKQVTTFVKVFRLWPVIAHYNGWLVKMPGQGAERATAFV